MKPLRLSALACAALVAGCATPMARRDLELTPQSKKGLVVVSFSNGWMEDVLWRYRRVGQQTGVGQPAGTAIDLRVFRNAPDAILGHANQVLYAFELPEGEYEFYSWVENSRHAYYASVSDFSIRFRAYAGRATYIGNVEIAMGGRTSYRLRLRDFTRHDVPRFLRSYPRITPEQVQIARPRLDGDDAAIEPVAYRPATPAP